MVGLDHVRWGILGCGDVCEHKSGPPLYQVEGSSLEAVMRRDAKQAADFARRHNVPRHYSSIDDLLADESLNAIYIATPPNVHREHVEQVAAAGKHILLEKPMALTEEGSEAINEVCRQHGVQLMIAYYRRFFPIVQKIKALLDEGAIGRPIRARAHHTGMYQPETDGTMPWRADPVVAGGGFMADAGIHRFDLFDYFFGPVKDVTAYADTIHFPLDVDDSSTIILRFQNEVHATAEFNWNVGVVLDEFEITGTEGRLLSRDLGAGRLELTNVNGIQSFTMPTFKYVHEGLVRHFVNCLRSGIPNELPGTTGIQATRMVLAAYKSSTNRRTVSL